MKKLLLIIAMMLFSSTALAQDGCLLALTDVFYHCYDDSVISYTYNYDVETDEWNLVPTIQYTCPSSCTGVTKIRTWVYPSYRYSYIYRDQNDDEVITDDEFVGTQTVFFDFSVKPKFENGKILEQEEGLTQNFYQKGLVE